MASQSSNAQQVLVPKISPVKENPMISTTQLTLLACLSLLGSQTWAQSQPTIRGPVRHIISMKATPANNASPLNPAPAGEVMTDRCSAEVAFVPTFNARPDSPGTIILKRGRDGRTNWTPPFTVGLGGSGHIRWWCHSTTGNMFDPGTWRITDLMVGTKCEIFADGTPENCHPDGSIKFGSSAWNGWTPERSRCGNRSRKIRARLGPKRLLQIECLGQ